MKNIGLIGVGAMGEPMGARLLQSGFSLTVCAHRNRERIERLLKKGAVEQPNPKLVAARSEALIMMVPDAPQVEEALFGEDGAMGGLAAGSYVIDMSTISPAASQAFHERLERSAVRMLDAPVSGGPARAERGELSIMVGGAQADFAACQPVLGALGKPVLVGPPGMGETVKLVNQVLIASIMIANAEALVFAKKSGADVDLVRRVILTATGSNYLLEKWLPQNWLAGTHAGGFALDLLRKDLHAALDAAAKLGVAMPATALANQLYTVAARTHGREDYSAVATLFEEAAGVSVASAAARL